MQLTIDSDEPLETVLQVVSAMYGVEVVPRDRPGDADPAEGDENQRTVKVRHT